MQRINDVTAQLDNFDEQLADLFIIATAFMYPDDLNNSKKVTESARAHSYYSVSTGTQIGEPSAVPFWSPVSKNI